MCRIAIRRDEALTTDFSAKERDICGVARTARGAMRAPWRRSTDETAAPPDDLIRLPLGFEYSAIALRYRWPDWSPGLSSCFMTLPSAKVTVDVEAALAAVLQRIIGEVDLVAGLERALGPADAAEMVGAHAFEGPMLATGCSRRERCADWSSPSARPSHSSFRRPCPTRTWRSNGGRSSSSVNSAARAPAARGQGHSAIRDSGHHPLLSLSRGTPLAESATISSHLSFTFWWTKSTGKRYCNSVQKVAPRSRTLRLTNS